MATKTNARDWLEQNPHVWIGTSVENQKTANQRIPTLLEIPASVRFLSMEPLLGPVDLERLPQENGDEINGLYGWREGDTAPTKHVRGIDWVIAGGESGPKARPMHPDWPGNILRQCKIAGTQFFFKQWGSWALSNYADLPNVWVDEDTGTVSERTSPDAAPPPFLSAAIMKNVGKHAAGSELEGRTWKEFPE